VAAVVLVGIVLASAANATIPGTINIRNLNNILPVSPVKQQLSRENICRLSSEIYAAQAEVIKEK
jgi:hypothetical protein